MQASEHGKAPALSIIIPTHNRCASLKRTLDAICAQTVSALLIEVLVVADGCTDDTVEMLSHYEAPFTLHVIVQASKGAAAARNCGAAQATGQLLLFLDDDVVPTPILIAAHMRAHQQQLGQVVIGHYPSAPQKLPSFFHSQLQTWWESKFSALSEPGHRFTYRDLLSGNFSIAAPLFNTIGGFDYTIEDCGGEDYEFGVRLLKANISFAFVAGAVGYHYVHETTDLERSFQRARQEGRVDVRIGQQHPELRFQLALAGIKSYRLCYRVILRLLIFQWPVVGDFLATHLQRALYGLERFALYDYWRNLYRFLHYYWYCRGVADKLGSWRALAHFTQGGQTGLSEHTSISELDLSQGLAKAAQQLDLERPIAVQIRYGQQPIGLVPPQPGAERLRGPHLRSILQNSLAVPLLEALAIEGAIPGSSKLDRYRLFRSIRAKSVWFGPTGIYRMWFEQYSQWTHLDQGGVQIKDSPSPDWERARIVEYETARLDQQSTDTRWRARMYRTLYRWHEPFYQWYTSRGWTWLTGLRAWVKQILLGAVGEPE